MSGVLGHEPPDFDDLQAVLTALESTPQPVVAVAIRGSFASLAVAEAMACGTPVVAYRRGSMPEVVDDGVTGFVVDDVDAAVDAVQVASTLDRHAVRERAASRFGVGRMVEQYLAVYSRILDG
jgi:glycosyltransferase involved in cell wall biosynthesis